MRILLLNYEFPPLGGGAAPVTQNVAEALAKKGHTFDLITMGFEGLKEEEQIGNIHVYRIPCGRKKKEQSNALEMLRFLKPALKKGRELCKQNSYDLIHCHFIIPTGYAARKLSKEFSIPYILSCHGSDVPGYNPDRFQLLHKLLHPFWKKIIDDAKLVLAPSEHMRNLVLKHYPSEEKVKTIYWGMEKAPKPGRKEKTIIFAGRLFERKGAQHLIEAAKGMDLQGYEILIVGNGPMRKQLEESAKGSNVRFLGWLPRDKLLDLYSTASIFVFPSTQESFGMVVIEAMAAGMAVIAANDSALPEVVGDAGVLVEPKNSEAIRTALFGLISNPKKIKEFGEKARLRSKQFTWQKTAEAYDQVYQLARKQRISPT